MKSKFKSKLFLYDPIIDQIFVLSKYNSTDLIVDVPYFSPASDVFIFNHHIQVLNHLKSTNDFQNIILFANYNLRYVEWLSDPLSYCVIATYTVLFRFLNPIDPLELSS